MRFYAGEDEISPPFFPFPLSPFPFFQSFHCSQRKRERLNLSRAWKSFGDLMRRGIDNVKSKVSESKRISVRLNRTDNPSRGEYARGEKSADCGSISLRTPLKKMARLRFSIFLSTVRWTNLDRELGPFLLFSTSAAVGGEWGRRRRNAERIRSRTDCLSFRYNSASMTWHYVRFIFRIRIQCLSYGESNFFNVPRAPYSTYTRFRNVFRERRNCKKRDVRELIVGESVDAPSPGGGNHN